ncbi:hypothetical protein BOTBODRAFT_366044 [Botryobasidium botryosum FD-172 SS1]|uniref:Uncharacterized protein n=1 Tax=Botryobasidium botryosum (strain FD-172 SS1) TaxID=930990 RepID=A0A067MDR5_BOTB1|nr:hypothetical protein BOTBODRAFT_366044 [Botryobasidium botryosum FD-172 SS1]
MSNRLEGDAGRPFQASFPLHLQGHPDFLQPHYDPRLFLSLAPNFDPTSILAPSNAMSSDEVDPHSMDVSALAPIAMDEPGCSEHDGVASLDSNVPEGPPAEVDVLLCMDTLKLSASFPPGACDALDADASTRPDAPHPKKAKPTPPAITTRSVSPKARSSKAVSASPSPDVPETLLERASGSPRPPRSKPLLSSKPTVKNGAGSAAKTTRPRPVGISKSVRRKDDQACDDPGAEGDKETDSHDVQMSVAGARRRTRRRHSLLKDGSRCPEDVKMKERGSSLKKVRRRRSQVKPIGSPELHSAQMAHKKARARRGRNCAVRFEDDGHSETKMVPTQRTVALQSM